MWVQLAGVVAELVAIGLAAWEVVTRVKIVRRYLKRELPTHKVIKSIDPLWNVESLARPPFFLRPRIRELERRYGDIRPMAHAVARARAAEAEANAAEAQQTLAAETDALRGLVTEALKATPASVAAVVLLVLGVLGQNAMVLAWVWAQLG